MRTIYFLSLIGFLLFSCDNSRTTNTDDLNIKKIKGPPYNIELEKNLYNLKSVPLSIIGKDLKYIPLETTNSSMLKRIKGIKLCGEYIFISDFNKLLQFDREGKFIRQIGSNGRGPGEYIYVNDFCIDEERKKVYILAWGINAILEFDLLGKFIGKSSTLPFYSSQVLVNDSSGFVFYVSDPPTNTNDSKNNLSFTDFECNSLFDIKRHFIRNSNLLVGRTPLYFINGFLRFQQYGVDTLYTVKKEIMEPYAFFNLGLLKMDPNIIFLRPGSLEEVSKKLKEKLCIKDVNENENTIFINLTYGISDSSMNLIFNKQTSEITSLENNGFTNDIDGGIPFWPKYVYSDSILVDYYDANSFINIIGKQDSKQLKAKFGENYVRFEKQVSFLDKLDNPILIILH